MAVAEISTTEPVACTIPVNMDEPECSASECPVQRSCALWAGRVLSVLEVIVGKRRIVLGLFCLGLTVLSCVAVAAPREITYVTVERDGMREVEVETPLARLILSEQGGVMKSAFVSFAPYGSSVSELVPGTTTNVKTFGRQYVADAIFPFALSVNGEQEGRYQLVDVGVDATTGVFRAVFRGNVAGTSIEKRYTIAPDAVYTIGFEIVVDNPTAAAAQVQMTVGNYVQKKAGGLEITYLFDGQPGTQLLARESYQAFGGVATFRRCLHGGGRDSNQREEHALRRSSPLPVDAGGRPAGPGSPRRRRAADDPRHPVH
jgi:hypothetical protein